MFCGELVVDPLRAPPGVFKSFIQYLSIRQ